MKLKVFEEFSPNSGICALRDKAYLHVTRRVLDSFKKAEDRRLAIKSKDDISDYRNMNREILCKSLGEVPYDSSLPLKSQITGTIEDGDLIIEKIAFQSLENMYVTANLYKPKNVSKKLPGIVFLCGHSGNGKAHESYQKSAKIIAKAGFVVLVTEPEGQGERIGYISSPDCEPVIYGAVANHQRFGHQCFLTGESPVKYFVADAMRAYDYLVTREDVDSEKIGITGNSGGGTLTALTAAYDERFKAAAPGCWCTSGEDYFFIGTSPDSEQIWPGIFENGFDHYELMSLICPRPLKLLTAAYDFVPIEGGKKLYKECSRIWNIFGDKNDIEIAISPNSHGYSEFLATKAAEFFQKHFSVDKFTVSNENISVLSDEKLNVCESGYVKFDFGSEFVFDKNLKVYNKSKNISSTEKKQEIYKKVFKNRSIDFEMNVRHFVENEVDGIYGKSYMWFTQHLLPNYAVMLCRSENKGENIPVTICLWEEGTNKIDENYEIINKILNSGRAAMILDITALGKCKPLPVHETDGDFRIIDKISKTLLQLGDSLCAMQAFDTVMAIKLLREQFNVKDIEIYTKDEYSVIARIVQMLENVVVSCNNEVTVESIVSNRIYKYENTHHILMYGLGSLID